MSRARGFVNGVLRAEAGHVSGLVSRGRVGAFEAIVLENDYLRAVILPELGGRVWELEDRIAGASGSGTGEDVATCRHRRRRRLRRSVGRRVGGAVSERRARPVRGPRTAGPWRVVDDGVEHVVEAGGRPGYRSSGGDVDDRPRTTA